MLNEKEVSKIETIVKEQSLLLPSDASLFFQRRTKPLFTGKCKQSNRDVVFRIALAEPFKTSLKRETELYSLSDSLRFSLFPEVISQGKDADAFWYTYDFIKGNILGNTYQIDPKYWDFSIIKKIFDTLNDLESLCKTMELEVADSEWWKHLILTILKKDKDLAQSKIVKKAVEKMNAFLDSKRFEYSSPVHGDLHPQNIIFPDQDKCKIIDWETIHRNSPSLDFSFLWIRSYDNKKRRELKNLMLSLYPRVEGESNFVFLVNALRDYFEWHLIVGGHNELIESKDLLPKTDPAMVIADLESIVTDLLTAL